MKAVMYTEYGPPERLRLVDIEKPVPKDNEVLVKVHATTVNRTDCGFRKPDYFIIRFFNGFFRPKKRIPGNEFSGVVEETGKKATRFRKGDEVFGSTAVKFGAHAEYLCVAEHGSIAMKPTNMTHEEAAAVCDGLILAKNYLRKIDFSRRKRILINGASGSIGSAAVQLARYYGARISAVCGTKNIDLIKTLGARKVIDYTKEDFTKDDQEYDAVLDAVGKSSFFKCRRLLKPEGIYFSTELGFLSQNIFLALLSPLSFGRKVKFPIPFYRRKDIEFFKGIIESGHYRAVIDRQYPLDQIVDATRYVETGQKTGNVVITIL